MKQLGLFPSEPVSFYLGLNIHQRINYRSHQRSLHTVMRVITKINDFSREESKKPMFTCRHGFFYNRAGDNRGDPKQFRVYWYKCPEIRDERKKLVGFDKENARQVKSVRMTYSEAKELIDLLDGAGDVNPEPVPPHIQYSPKKRDKKQIKP